MSDHQEQRFTHSHQYIKYSLESELTNIERDKSSVGPSRRILVLFFFYIFE